MRKKGWIVLDIDGTITVKRYEVPKPVVQFLQELFAKGWNIALATGRSFTFARPILESFPFPLKFLAQNGSLALEMPERKVLFHSDIPKEKWKLLEAAYEGVYGDFAIYGGFEKGDVCFYRAGEYFNRESSYLEELRGREEGKWDLIETFDQLDLQGAPLVKAFGSSQNIELVQQRLESTQAFQLACIRDPFGAGRHLLLVTDGKASKGLSSKRLKESHEPLIVAGDDANDLSLFEVADYRIAMAHAPDFLKKRADCIAPPTEQMGIIDALQKAVASFG